MKSEELEVGYKNWINSDPIYTFGLITKICRGRRGGGEVGIDYYNREIKIIAASLKEKPTFQHIPLECIENTLIQIITRR